MELREVVLVLDRIIEFFLGDKEAFYKQLRDNPSQLVSILKVNLDPNIFKIRHLLAWSVAVDISNSYEPEKILLGTAIEDTLHEIKKYPLELYWEKGQFIKYLEGEEEKNPKNHIRAVLEEQRKQLTTGTHPKLNKQETQIRKYCSRITTDQTRWLVYDYLANNKKNQPAIISKLLKEIVKENTKAKLIPEIKELILRVCRHDLFNMWQQYLRLYKDHHDFESQPGIQRAIIKSYFENGLGLGNNALFMPVYARTFARVLLATPTGYIGICKFPKCRKYYAKTYKGKHRQKECCSNRCRTAYSRLKAKKSRADK